MILPRRRRELSADPAELLSITERARYLFGLRIGFAGVVTTVALARDGTPTVAISIATAAYLALSLLSAAIVRRGGRAAVPVLQGTLLVDGLYLATVIAQTAGTAEAIRLLPYVHVVGVTLLCSYRTGLKLALWHTLLFLLVIEAARAGILDGRMTEGIQASFDAGNGEGAVLTVAGLWMFALGTAVFSAAGDRQLRRQKHDLSRLSDMVARMDADPEMADIPNVLLEELRSTFGFVRGVVIASPRGDLELLAWSGTEKPADLAVGVDRAVSRAWGDRASQLLRAIDPATDPRLASLVPDARNVLVVPLLRGQRQGLGAVVLECGRERATMRRWVIAMVEQFAEHAALALHNAWLTEEREAQLRTIQNLEQQLRTHNEELEAKVAERTEELRDVITSLQEIDEQRRRLLEHVVRAAEEERTRIAHDIHDDPVQKIVALKMQLELLGKKHPGLPEVDDALEVVRITIRSMRTLLFDLSPPTLEDEGLGSALTYLLENSGSSFAWTVDDGAMAEDPPIRSSLILYRIAQEAVANARKHSQAAHVRVTLARRDGGTSMQIVDDGVGFMPQDAVVAAPGHLGLAAIRERAEMAGGSCKLWSLPGEGTTMEVWVPDGEGELARAVKDTDGSIAEVLLLPDRVEGPPQKGAMDPQVRSNGLLSR
ncbi:MAG: GAF domain-containing sensor histidine kinase [Actinomycetota bacterium]|nr:GAF domain-containing sensor histidine kinase [Actinomycetota bacterium]